MSEKNPYLVYLDVDENKPTSESSKKSDVVSQPVSSEPESVQKHGDIAAMYEALNETEPPEHRLSESAPGALAGAAAGYLSTGAGMNPFRPSPGVIESSSLNSLLESITGAPPGSISDVNALMNPAKVAMTPEAAARMAAEARIPPSPPMPIAPASEISESSGAKWKRNWANTPDAGFEGGVPEAAQSYQRQKPQGKVTSKLYKKFGNMPLNIQGQMEANAAQEAAAMEKARQAVMAQEAHAQAVLRAEREAAQRAAQVAQETKAASMASKMAGPLATFGRLGAGAGIGFGGYDAYRRYQEGNPKGAALAAGLTGVSSAIPITSPLAMAAMELYDNPEARQKFLNAMKPGGAWQQRMDTRFGLD